VIPLQSLRKSILRSFLRQKNEIFGHDAPYD